MYSKSHDGLVEERRCVRINAPLIFQDPEFVAWLNSQECHVATWHKKGGKPGQHSDCFMTICYDSQSNDCAEGSDSDMPTHCFEAIVKSMYSCGIHEYEGVVWITNLEE